MPTYRIKTASETLTIQALTISLACMVFKARTRTKEPIIEAVLLTDKS